MLFFFFVTNQLVSSLIVTHQSIYQPNIYELQDLDFRLVFPTGTSHMAGLKLIYQPLKTKICYHLYPKLLYKKNYSYQPKKYRLAVTILKYNGNTIRKANKEAGIVILDYRLRR